MGRGSPELNSGVEQSPVSFPGLLSFPGHPGPVTSLSCVGQKAGREGLSTMAPDVSHRLGALSQGPRLRVRAQGLGPAPFPPAFPSHPGPAEPRGLSRGAQRFCDLDSRFNPKSVPCTREDSPGNT